MNYLNNYPSLYPGVIVATTFAFNRAASGAIGLGAIYGSKLADYFGQEDLRLTLNAAGNHLIVFANREGKTEKEIIEHLLTLGVISEFSLNILASEINNISHLPQQHSFQSYTGQEVQNFSAPYVIQNSTKCDPPTPQMYSEGFLPTAYKVANNIGENPFLVVKAPFLTTVAASIAARTTAGVLAILAKATGTTMDLVGLDSQRINETADTLIDLAKNNFNFEATVLSFSLVNKSLSGFYDKVSLKSLGAFLSLGSFGSVASFPPLWRKLSNPLATSTEQVGEDET